MHYKVFTTITLFGLLVLPVASAQVSQPVQANIPFDFGAQNMVLPAGNYQFDTHLNGSLSIRGLDGVNANTNIFISSTFQPGTSPPRNGEATVVLNQYGGTYFLSQLWRGYGDSSGRELPRTSRERNLAARISHQGVERASITVPAR